MIDEKDEAIIGVLRRRGDASTREISDETGIPASTVHQRKQRLEEHGVIEQYTVDVDWSQVGYEFTAYVVMTVDLSQLRRRGLQQEDLLDEVRGLHAVADAHIITGEHDILISVRAADKESFNTILQGSVQSLTGVQDTVTMIALS